MWPTAGRPRALWCERAAQAGSKETATHHTRAIATHTLTLTPPLVEDQQQQYYYVSSTSSTSSSMSAMDTATDDGSRPTMNHGDECGDMAAASSAAAGSAAASASASASSTLLPVTSTDSTPTSNSGEWSMATMALPTEPGIIIASQKTCAVPHCTKRSQGAKYLFMCARHCREWSELHPAEAAAAPRTSSAGPRGRKRRLSSASSRSSGTSGKKRHGAGGKFAPSEDPNEPDMTTRSQLLTAMPKPTQPRYVQGAVRKGLCAVEFLPNQATGSTISYACGKQSQGQRTFFMCARHCREWLAVHPDESARYEAEVRAQKEAEKAAARAQALEMQRKRQESLKKREMAGHGRSRRAAVRGASPVPGGYGGGGSGRLSPMPASVDGLTEAKRRLEINGGKVRKFVRVKREIRRDNSSTGVIAKVWKWLPADDIVDAKERRDLGLPQLQGDDEKPKEQKEQQGQMQLGVNATGGSGSIGGISSTSTRTFPPKQEEAESESSEDEDEDEEFEMLWKKLSRGPERDLNANKTSRGR